MAEFLIEKGYEVHGIIRRSSSFNTGRIAHLYDDPNSHKEGKMVLHYGDLIDGSCLVKIISEVTFFSRQNTNALSFYRFLNVLCWSKFFEPVQKFNCIYCLFKNFCPGKRTNCTECKSSFCLVQNVCDSHNM